MVGRGGEAHVTRGGQALHSQASKHTSRVGSRRGNVLGFATVGRHANEAGSQQRQHIRVGTRSVLSFA